MRLLCGSLLLLCLGLSCRPQAKDGVQVAAAPRAAAPTALPGTPWAMAPAAGGHDGCNHDQKGKMTCCPDPAGGEATQAPQEESPNWTTARIFVEDKKSGRADYVQLKVGQKRSLAFSGLRMEVDRIVPTFRMGGHEIPDVPTDQALNPAAQVRIFEGRREVFRGWLFSRFPDTHAFQHPQFSVRLMDLGRSEI